MLFHVGALVAILDFLSAEFEIADLFISFLTAHPLVIHVRRRLDVARKGSVSVLLSIEQRYPRRGWREKPNRVQFALAGGAFYHNAVPINCHLLQQPPFSIRSEGGRCSSGSTLIRWRLPNCSTPCTASSDRIRVFQDYGRVYAQMSPSHPYIARLLEQKLMIRTLEEGRTLSNERPETTSWGENVAKSYWNFAAEGSEIEMAALRSSCAKIVNITSTLKDRWRNGEVTLSRLCACLLTNNDVIISVQGRRTWNTEIWVFVIYRFHRSPFVTARKSPTYILLPSNRKCIWGQKFCLRA